jgi:hypothetical protein
MKKRKTDEEITAELVEKDENFRRLHDKVVALNGGRLPTSEEIDQRIREYRERHRGTASA